MIQETSGIHDRGSDGTRERPPEFIKLEELSAMIMRINQVVIFSIEYVTQHRSRNSKIIGTPSLCISLIN